MHTDKLRAARHTDRHRIALPVEPSVYLDCRGVGRRLVSYSRSQVVAVLSVLNKATAVRRRRRAADFEHEQSEFVVEMIVQ